jgi:hypothetical protein
MLAVPRVVDGNQPSVSCASIVRRTSDRDSWPMSQLFRLFVFDGRRESRQTPRSDFCSGDHFTAPPAAFSRRDSSDSPAPGQAVRLRAPSPANHAGLASRFSGECRAVFDFVLETWEELRWTWRGRTLQLEQRYNCRSFFQIAEVYNFKFMNCKVGNIDKLLMHFMFPIAYLKRYFMPLASASQSKPNTCEDLWSCELRAH